MTVRGYKFEKTSGCVFKGPRALYLGPQKAVMDEEGHFFPRNELIEVCTDTAAKLTNPPYKGSFVILEPDTEGSRTELFQFAPSDTSCCSPGDSEKSCC